MQHVFVLDKNKQALMPCQPSRARKLLKLGKAAVFRMHPFTIILTQCNDGETQPIEIKFDPGSKTTGIAIVTNNKVVWAANLLHRGGIIKSALESRRAIRRGRRFRNTRYRKPRFDNRKRCDKWLPPSLISRVNNVHHWTNKLSRFINITSISVETVRFDTQQMQDASIEGTDYQKGTLFGYEIKEYLLEKWGRQCVYCRAENIRLEIDHIVPRSRGGSSRPSNLTISCRPCNAKKSNHTLQQFLKEKPATLQKILKGSKISLRDTAAVNATRHAIGNTLKSFSIPISFWSGGRTKFNRQKQNYPKDHWIDAACVGSTGEKVRIPKFLQPIEITATGRGSRQMCRVNKFGFPRTSSKGSKIIKGFQTGDLVIANVLRGKKKGKHIGRVAVRSSGNFNIKTKTNTVQGISWKDCRKIHCSDGYNYNFK